MGEAKAASRPSSTPPSVAMAEFEGEQVERSENSVRTSYLKEKGKHQVYARLATEACLCGGAGMPKLACRADPGMDMDSTSGSPGASSLSSSPGCPGGSLWAPKPVTLKMLVRPPLVAICSCSWSLASWYCRLMGLNTGCGIRGWGFQLARAFMTAPVSSSESTGPLLASSSSSKGAFASNAASVMKD